MGLHPRAISVVLLLVLELLKRGYRVCISTHSPQVLEMVWAIKRLRGKRSKAADILNLFTDDPAQRAELRGVADAVKKKSINVYYFGRADGKVRDISDLDTNSKNLSEASWGGLTEFSERANNTVAQAVADAVFRRGQ
jgi:hypothetical protein